MLMTVSETCLCLLIILDLFTAAKIEPDLLFAVVEALKDAIPGNNGRSIALSDAAKLLFAVNARVLKYPNTYESIEHHLSQLFSLLWSAMSTVWAGLQSPSEQDYKQFLSVRCRLPEPCIALPTHIY
jgi:hypothetical protein